jgi:zinc protease
MNSIRHLSSLLFVTLLGCASASLNENSVKKEELPFFGSFPVHRFTLNNGLKILVVEDHSSPTFAYQTWFNVGSRDEIVGRTGLAHLFEHMMFKETKNLKDGEFDRLLESAGAEGENAFTSRDYTAYIQELPKNKLDLITRLESDRMVNLVINQAAFSTEREVVQNERRFRNENSPDGLMNQELFELAFNKHPYHWPVIGYQKDLASMSVQDALNFYQSYYSPNHATIVVVGDVSPNQVLDLIQKYYGHLKPQKASDHAIPAEPNQKAPRRKDLKLNIQVEKLIMGYPIPSITHPDIPVLDVIQSTLTGGKSSRLHQTLVETGIASAVECYDIEDKDPSLFVFVANLQKGRKAKEAETVILKELEKLKKEPVSTTELERAKNKLNFGFYEGLGSNFEKARFLGQYETSAGDFREGIRHHDRIQNITANEVLEVAKKYFDPNRRTVITGVKK